MPKRCGACKVKVGLLGFSCQGCLVEYCASHRLAEDHACPRMHVFRTQGERVPEKIVAPKVAKI